jgi:hypothetical protein
MQSAEIRLRLTGDAPLTTVDRCWLLRRQTLKCAQSGAKSALVGRRARDRADRGRRRRAGDRRARADDGAATFRVALYRFATQDVVLAPFQREPLENAFKVHSRRWRAFTR